MVGSVVEYEELPDWVRSAVDAARAVRGRAYCPYSKFQVGAALVTDDGAIVSGANVENASFGLTICAERSAVCAAVAQGKTVFRCVAICAEMDQHYVGPCGACRQVLVEFGDAMDVYLCRPLSGILRTSVAELMPLSFNPRWVSF